jgi:hypothetical protein
MNKVILPTTVKKKSTDVFKNETDTKGKTLDQKFAA